MTDKLKVKDQVYGKNRELIPNIAFRLMSFCMKTVDILTKKSDKKFKSLKLKRGQTVIDYGCGPARYIVNASRAVGPEGKVFATDIHPLAIEKVEKKIRKYKLENVEAVLVEGYESPLKDETAHIVYALDMFHMIKNPKPFLKELCRLVKPDGTIIIEDGHQERKETIGKIVNCPDLRIVEENDEHVKCSKIG